MILFNTHDHNIMAQHHCRQPLPIYFKDVSKNVQLLSINWVLKKAHQTYLLHRWRNLLRVNRQVELSFDVVGLLVYFASYNNGFLLFVNLVTYFDILITDRGWLSIDYCVVPPPPDMDGH